MTILEVFKAEAFAYATLIEIRQRLDGPRLELEKAIDAHQSAMRRATRIRAFWNNEKTRVDLAVYSGSCANVVIRQQQQQQQLQQSQG